jgi:chromosome segregation ATPase
MDEVTKAELRRIDDENARQNKRIEKLENTMEEIRKISTSVERLAINMENMLSEQKKQGDRLDELEAKPAEAWTTMQRTILTTICGALAGAVAFGLMQMIAVYAAR